MSRSIPYMPHVNFLMGIGMFWFSLLFPVSSITILSHHDHVSSLQICHFCRLLGATCHANGLCDVHHPSIGNPIWLSCGWTTTEVRRFHLSGQSEPAPPTSAPMMDGKWSVNSFLFNSSSLAQFSVVVSSVTFFFYYLSTNNPVAVIKKLLN